MAKDHKSYKLRALPLRFTWSVSSGSIHLELNSSFRYPVLNVVVVVSLGEIIID